MIRKHFRFRRRIFIGLAFASLVAAPVTQASTGFYVDGGPAPRSESSTLVALSTPITSENSAQTLSRPQVEAMAWQALMDYQNAAPIRSENSVGAGGPSGVTSPQVSASISGASSVGFNWDDARIGASVAFGVALLLLISVFIGRRNRDRTGLASA